MKKGLLLMLAAVAVASASFCQEKPFTLTGKLSEPNNDIKLVYLYYSSNGTRLIDSTAITNGTYSFKGKVSDPVLAQVRPSFNSRKTAAKDVYQVFLEGSNINVAHTDTLFGKTTVSGSASNDEYEKINALLKPYNDKIQDINKKYADAAKAKDQAEVDKQREAYYALDNEMRENVYADYVKSNPNSPIVFYAMSRYIGSILEPNKVEPLFNTLPASVKASATGKKLWDRIDIAKKTEIGQVAPDFTQNDTSGHAVSLSSKRGKYLLVDFWASWCGPCRQENPNVVAAYNKYKDKGFSVFGVSLDDNDKEAWVKAINDDKLFWTQVSDLKYWENAVAKQYGIQAIPQNYLLDPSGKIIGKNLRGEALVKKLDEVFAGK